MKNKNSLFLTIQYISALVVLFSLVVLYFRNLNGDVISTETLEFLKIDILKAGFSAIVFILNIIFMEMLKSKDNK